VIGLNLKTEKQKTIGLLYLIFLILFLKFLAVSKSGRWKGYNVIMCISNESMDKEAHTLEMLSNGTIDGLFCQCLKKHKNWLNTIIFPYY
jgi:LacI family transcriptional regulator